MNIWVAFACGVGVGSLLGVFVMCLMFMAGRTSREMGE